MAWNYDSIVGTEDDPTNEASQLVSVKFTFESDATEKVVVFNLAKDATQEQMTAAIGAYLVEQLNLFIKITKDDITVGYNAILGMLAGIASLEASVLSRKEKALDTIVLLDEQAAVLANQKSILTQIIGYLQARAV